MTTPTRDQLIDYLRSLFEAAQNLSDHFRDRVDHYEFIGGMNDIEMLRETLDRGRYDDTSGLSTVLYPPGELPALDDAASDPEGGFGGD